jgi:hypothetical protein
MESQKAAEHDRLFTESWRRSWSSAKAGLARCQGSHRADDLVHEAITKLYLNWHAKLYSKQKQRRRCVPIVVRPPAPCPVTSEDYELSAPTSGLAKAHCSHTL